MGKNSRRFGGGKSIADTFHNLNEQRRHDGLLVAPSGKHITEDGVFTYKPTAYGGTAEFGTGDYVNAHGQRVRVYDGNVREISTEVWKRDRATTIQYEEHLLELVETFIKGSDDLANKYMTTFYSYLAPFTAGATGKGSFFNSFAKAAGIDETLITDELTLVDARPSAIKAMSELSDKFGYAIQKMKMIVSFCGFVFKGAQLPIIPEGSAPDPDMLATPNIADGTTIVSNSKSLGVTNPIQQQRRQGDSPKASLSQSLRTA